MPPAPYELLDDGFAPPSCEVLVIGCGNILRGDDAVGPVLVRHLHERGVPDGVRLVDGGTAGMDVAFAMRGAGRVVIVDAARTGNEPGTTYRLPAEALAQLPPVDGVHTHNFRWDHALALGDWLLGPDRPTDVTVLLVEAGGFEPGAPLTPPVEAAMLALADLVETEFWPVREEPWRVDITAMGYLHLPAALAAQHFPADVCVGRVSNLDSAWALDLLPLQSPANGGLVLKQHDPAGNRSLLVSEILGFASVDGRFEAHWLEAEGLLRIHLEETADDRPRRDHPGGGGAGTVDGLPGGDLAGGRGATAPGQLADRGEGPLGGRRRTPERGAPAPATGGAW